VILVIVIRVILVIVLVMFFMRTIIANRHSHLGTLDVTELLGAWFLHIMKSFLGCSGQSIMRAQVMFNAKYEVIVTTFIGRAILIAPSIKKVGIGRVASVFVTLGCWAAWGTFNETSLDVTGYALLVVVMEAILNLRV
jgi:hypothetical protein